MRGADNLSFWSLLLFCFIIGCTKPNELPELPDNDPEFFLEGQIGGSTLRLVAGVDRYYMFTSNTQDTLGVLSFKGRLADFECLNICQNSLSIEIRDNQVFQETGTFDIMEAINPSVDYGFFQVYPQDTTQAGKKQLSTVIITYYDEQITRYSSEFINQDSSSYFRITFREDFKENENDEPTLRVGGRVFGYPVQPTGRNP